MPSPIDAPKLLQLDGLWRAAGSVERLLAAGADTDAARLLGRTIDALGVELAKVDPVTAAIVDLDAELSRLALARLTGRAGVALPARVEPCEAMAGAGPH